MSMPVRRALLSVSDKTRPGRAGARRSRSATSRSCPPAAPRSCWPRTASPVREVAELHRLSGNHGRARQDAASEDSRRTARAAAASTMRSWRSTASRRSTCWWSTSTRSRRPSRAPDCSYAEAIENIDIGGPAMLRAAAKNHDDVLGGGRSGRLRRAARGARRPPGGSDFATRARLAAKAFAHTAALRHHGRRLPRQRNDLAAAGTSRRRCRWSSTRCRTCATAKTRTSARRFYRDPAARGCERRARARAAGQGPVVQQHRRRRHRDRVRAAVRAAAPASSSSTPIRAAWRVAATSARGLRARVPHRSDLRLRRHHRLQPRARCAPPRAAIIERQFVEVLAAPRVSAEARAAAGRQAQRARAACSASSPRRRRQ